MTARELINALALIVALALALISDDLALSGVAVALLVALAWRQLRLASDQRHPGIK